MIGLGLSLPQDVVRQPPSGIPPVVALLAMNDREAWDGDSRTIGAYGPVYIDSDMLASGGRLSYQGQSGAYNTAVSGITAKSISDPSHLAMTMATNPKCVKLWAGTNDVSGSDSAAVIYGYLKTCWKYYIDHGAACVIGATEPARGGSNALAPDREAVRVALNGLIHNYATDSDLASYAAKIGIADIDAVWDWTTDTVGDGLHPNWKGARKVGAVFGAATNLFLPSSATLTGAHLLTSNRYPDKALTGSGGTAVGNITGRVPTQYFVQADDELVIVLTDTTDAAGYPAIRMQISGTTTNDRSVIFGGHPVMIGGVAGDRFEQTVYVKLAASSTNLKTMYLDGLVYSVRSTNAGETHVMDTAPAVEGFLRSEMSNPSGGGFGNEYPIVHLAFATGTVAADITMSQFRLVIVPTAQ